VKAGLPVWLTEFGIQSLPDPSFGVPQATQNEYRAISERIAWFNSRVVAFSQYLLRDDRPIAGKRGAARYGGFESGLRTANGKDKIALAGFRLPVVARRSGSSVALWGLVRPARAATTVRLERSVSGRAFRAVANVRTSSTGAWTRRVGFARGLRFRVRWTSPSGQQLTSPAVRVF
jgi:hypothetical protein